LEDGLAWNDDMGEITWFIEGPWVQELPELLKRIRAHEKSVLDRRSAPKLEAMKKRFGL
jgi:peptidoglycan/xylan/chitin deacetylase (PgdA/CDA1 family)